MRARSLLVCCLLLLTGCAGGGHDATPDKSGNPEFYDQPPRTVRPDEHAVHAPVRPSGEIEFQLLGLTTGIKAVAGSHIEIPSVHGQDVRARIVVHNTGHTTFDMKLSDTKLVTSDGRSFSPDEDTMRLKRQPLEPSIGAADRLEFDLWWDIAADLVPQTLKLLGTSPYSTADPPTADFPLS